MSHRSLAPYVARFALLLSLLSWGCAFAQLPGLSLKPTTTAEKTAEPEAPATIEVGELPRRLLEENLFLQQAAQRNDAGAKIDALERRIGDIKRSVGTLVSKIVSKEFDTLPYSGLEARTAPCDQARSQAPQKIRSMHQSQRRLISRQGIRIPRHCFAADQLHVSICPCQASFFKKSITWSRSSKRNAPYSPVHLGK